MGIGQLLGGLVGGYGEIQNARFQSELAKQNAAFRELDAKDALLRGRQQQQKVRRNAAQTVGEIQLAAAAQGQSVGAGSVAGNLMAEADILSEQDVSIIKNNAMREAFGYRLQGQQMVTQAKMNENLAWAKAGSSVATAGMSFFKAASDKKNNNILGKESNTGLSTGSSNMEAWRKA